MAAAVITATAGMAAIVPASQALAETGRRICRYTWAQSMGNADGRTISFVANYKKDGKCPDVSRHKIKLHDKIGAWMPSPDAWEDPPVPKMTCEEFQEQLDLPDGPDGDPCTYLRADVFYAVGSPIASDTAQTPRVWTVDCNGRACTVFDIQV
jgi:hypothetical protein